MEGKAGSPAASHQRGALASEGGFAPAHETPIGARDAEELAKKMQMEQAAIVKAAAEQNRGLQLAPPTDASADPGADEA